VIRYRTETTIRRPPSAVFAAMLDPDRYGDWTDMTDVRFDGERPPALGTRGRFRLPKSPFRGDLEMEIVEFQQDQRVVFRVTHPSLTWVSWAETRPNGEGTGFVYGGEMKLHGWRRLLEPLLRAEIANGEAQEAERLKVVLEAEAPDAAATPQVAPA
jgi:uncharacterized protein YndB with AHSA1/START domain